MGKNETRRKIFCQCASFSLFWSAFYMVRVLIYVISHRNKAVDEDIEWEFLQGMLSIMGVLTSLSMYNAYKNTAKFLVGSWIFWMFSNLTLSLFLLHISLFELYSSRRDDSIRLLNDLLDLIHVINAPGSIYFILIFVAHTCIRQQKSTDVLFGTMKTIHGYEKLRKYEVLHVHEGLDEEEIVYYV